MAAVGIAGAIGYAGVALAGNVSAAPPAAPVADLPKLIEAPSCGIVEPPTGTLTAAASAGATMGATAKSASGANAASAVVAITVTIPRLAVIRLDAAGKVASAFTNTRCAPRSSDDVYLVDAAGNFLNEHPVHELPVHVWQGDFTQPGVFQPQH